MIRVAVPFGIGPTMGLVRNVAPRKKDFSHFSVATKFACSVATKEREPMAKRLRAVKGFDYKLPESTKRTYVNAGDWCDKLPEVVREAVIRRGAVIQVEAERPAKPIDAEGPEKAFRGKRRRDK